MIDFYKIKKIIEFKKVKFLIKYFKKLLLFIYSIFITPFSIFLFSYFKNRSQKNNNQRFISLRITKKYFGHQAIEPAIASSIIKNNKNFSFLISYKEKNIPGNKKLNIIIKNTFYIQDDIFLFFIEHIYNYSNNFLILKIKKFYYPLISKRERQREFKYYPELLSEKNFLWKKNALKVIEKNISKESKDNIVIALRSKHFHQHSKKVKPQPSRDADINDLIHIIDVCEEINQPQQIVCYTNKLFEKDLTSKYIKNPKIKIVLQEEIDILEILNGSSLLISNSNGIGAAAFAMGLKTLYLQHSPWHIWCTSHSNSIMLPIEYEKTKGTNKRNLYDIFNLAFYPTNEIPIDFELNFKNKNIKLQSIKNIDKEIIKGSIKEAICLDYLKLRKKSEKYLDCLFHYETELEKDFWINYINRLPPKIKYWHKNIKMNISKSFLNSFF